MTKVSGRITWVISIFLRVDNENEDVLVPDTGDDDILDQDLNITEEEVAERNEAIQRCESLS